MSAFRSSQYKKIGNQAGSSRSLNFRNPEPGETLSASVNLEDIIEDYDGSISQKGSKSSLASILNTLHLSSSYFSVYETVREDETTSFHSALQDGFSIIEHEFHASNPNGQKRDQGNFLWNNEDCDSERDMMLPQSNFQVFWHDLAYKIKPRITLGSLWYDVEQATKARISSVHKMLNCHQSESYDVSDATEGSGKFTKEPLKIIQQISGSFKSGELTAVMGPSGAGKTSLLNFLSRRQEDGYSGSLYVDNSYRRVKISTIPQNDHLPEYLTVRENLLFASRLKNPQKKYDHSKNIETVSRLLGLEECLDTRTKKISGGQHKRLAIAQELLSRPDILILDEPTSGLDSLTCFKTLAVLKDLVRSSSKRLIDPIAIVLTIHQPQQDVFEIFDKIYVMANGGIAIYDGPPTKCTEFIERYSGIKIQDQHYNPASFVVEIASGEHGEEPIRALEAQVKSEFENNRTELAHRLALKSSTLQINNEQSKLKQTKKYWKNNLLDEKSKFPASLNGARRKSFLYIDQRLAQGYTINQGSFLTKTGVLSERYWLSLIRDPKQILARLIFHVILPVSIAFIMGSEPGKANACPRFKARYQLNELIKDESTVSEAVQEELFLTLENVALLFTMLYALISASIGAVTLSFTLDMQSSLKEYYNGWYSMPSYVIARIVTDIPMGIFLPVLTLGIGYPLTGQLTGDDSGLSVTYRVLISALAVVLGSMIGQTLGMIFGAIYIGHVSTALFASQAAILPFVFLSGFVVRTKNMAKFVYGLSFLSFYRHVLDVTIIARYGFNVCNCNSSMITGKDVELLGVSDQLRSFTDYWLNTLADQAPEEDMEVENSTAAAVTTTVAPLINSTTDQDDIFKMFAKQISLYNTYGIDVKSCRDIIPKQMHELSLDETHLSSAFLSLIILLIVTQLLLFVTVKFVVYFRKSL